MFVLMIFKLPQKYVYVHDQYNQNTKQYTKDTHIKKTFENKKNCQC